jgi:renal tumor antigen
MDVWGVGCVMFEVIALFPLFPGANELDQVERIHDIMGSPPPQVLERYKRCSPHVNNYSFATKSGSGISKLIPKATADTVSLLEGLLR